MMNLWKEIFIIVTFCFLLSSEKLDLEVCPSLHHSDSMEKSCSTFELLYEGQCVDKMNIWTCHGEKLLKHSPCKDQPCNNSSQNCLSDGKCPEDWCLVGDACQFRKGFYSCGSRCQQKTVPCDGECPLEYEKDKIIELCIQDGKCKPVPIDHYSCGGQCRFIKDPCQGSCERGHKYTKTYYTKVLFNGTCISLYELWDCYGELQWKNTPCESKTEDYLQCPLEYCLDETKTTCERKFGYYTCSGICQKYDVPCYEECPEKRYLVNGTCLAGWAVWECDGAFINRNTPCKNETEYYCHTGYVMYKGKCKAESGLWQCHGEYQLEETPCTINGTTQCKTARYTPCKNETEYYCHTGYVMYKGKCKAESDLWQCHGEYQLEETPCTINGKTQCKTERYTPRCLSSSERKCKIVKRDSWICDHICISVNETCHGKCGWRGVREYKLVDDRCVDEEHTWKCKGKDQFQSTPCTDGLCPLNYCLEKVTNQPEQVLVSSTGGASEKQNKRMGVFHKMQNITRFELPVYKKTDGTSSEYLYYIDKYWKIGGNFDLAYGGIVSANVGQISPVQVAEWFYFDKEWVYDQTLEIRKTNGSENSVFLPIGGICKQSDGKDYSCKVRCQSWSLPCDEICPKNLCMVDDRCTSAPHGYYSCGSVCQPLTVPCHGKCPRTDLDDSINVEDTCTYGEKEFWQCNGKTHFLGTPCEEKCPENRLFVGGQCITLDKTWVCGDQHQLLEEPCHTCCPKNHFLWNEKCINQTSGWKCEGVRQPMAVPCNNFCSNIMNKNYTIGPTLLTDYVNCQGVCMLREDVWGCNDSCIALNRPCSGECHPGFIFTGDDCVDVGINYNWIVLRGELVLSHHGSCKPWSRCFAAVAVRRYFSSSTSALSTTTISSAFTNLVEQKDGSKITKGNCPPLFCRTGNKCCLIAWGGQNFVCPTSC